MQEIGYIEPKTGIFRLTKWLKNGIIIYINVIFNIKYMRGEAKRGVEAVQLTDTDKAMIEAGLQQVVPLEDKKKSGTRFAEGTNPGLKRVKEDFSDVESQLNSSERLAVYGYTNDKIDEERAERKTTDKLKNLEASVPFDTQDALKMVRQEIKNREGDEAREAGEIGDRIFAKVEQGIATENKIRKEMQSIKALRDTVEQAVAAYAKAYAEYDPKFVAKFYAGKESVQDKLAAYDLTSVTKPPLTAVFNAKGRKLRNLYEQMTAAVKNFNAAMEKNK